MQAVLCFTPDANHSLDGNRTKTTYMKCNVPQVGHPHNQDHEETEYNFRQRHTQIILDSFETGTKGASRKVVTLNVPISICMPDF